MEGKQKPAPRPWELDSGKFISAVKHRLMQGGPGVYSMGNKELGKPPGRDITAYEAFIDMVAEAEMSEGAKEGEFYIPEPEGAFYLVACVVCYMEKYSSGSDGRRVRFEELLHRVRIKSATTSGRVSRLLKARWHEDNEMMDASFRHIFMEVFTLCKGMIEPGEKLSYARLLDDLKNWEAPSRSVQKRWSLAACGVRSNDVQEDDIETQATQTETTGTTNGPDKEEEDLSWLEH